jgi:DNA primase small subunit
MEEDAALAAGSSPAAEEGDIAMAEAGEIQGVVEDAKPVQPPPAQTAEDEDMGVEIKQETKTELKLEDLFDGMDSDDDDFPTSSNPLNNQEPV